MNRITKEERITVYDKIVKNIIEVMDDMHISKSNDKIEEYIKYIIKNAPLSEKRVRAIFRVNTIRAFTLEDLCLISYALHSSPNRLFRGITNLSD